MRVEDKVKNLVIQREALAAEYAAKQRDIEFAILNEIDVEYSTVSARIEQDRQTLQDLAMLRNETKSKLGLSDNEPAPVRKIVKMSRREIANVPVENGAFVPRTANDAIRHLLRDGEMPGHVIATEMTKRWNYSANAFYSAIRYMGDEVVSRKGVGTSKIYRLVTT